MPTLTQLNQMSQDDFTSVLAEIFEATPQIATSTWPKRPFASLNDLHAALVETMHGLDESAQLNLLCAHPDLGSRLEMAPSSVAEQTGAGLTQLSPEEYQQFESLNTAYRQTFGFPFILAVKGLNKADILANFEQRLHHSQSVEKSTALDQIAQIAWLRLTETIQ